MFQEEHDVQAGSGSSAEAAISALVAGRGGVGTKVRMGPCTVRRSDGTPLNAVLFRCTALASAARPPTQGGTQGRLSLYCTVKVVRDFDLGILLPSCTQLAQHAWVSMVNLAMSGI